MNAIKRPKKQSNHIAITTPRCLASPRHECRGGKTARRRENSSMDSFLHVTLAFCVTIISNSELCGRGRGGGLEEGTEKYWQVPQGLTVIPRNDGCPQALPGARHSATAEN
ncbi:hypothetical protein E2C01_081222 [Portunus trituberculatus]|uniref:Uncharacterized protein n=1 Tax=Portunus trituberculatus TaxID=210409 RepID=A0A5B7IXD6_PORTR|nr:hypothetical protein [Portunus trituberculatus]